MVRTSGHTNDNGMRAGLATLDTAPPKVGLPSLLKEGRADGAVDFRRYRMPSAEC